MGLDDGGALLHAIEGLRSDMREDINALRSDLRDVEDRMVRSVTEYTSLHAGAHSENARIRDEAHARFDQFINDSKIATARRDGALGVVRFVFELVAHNSAPLVRLVIAIAAAALVVGGNVHVAIQ